LSVVFRKEGEKESSILFKTVRVCFTIVDIDRGIRLLKEVSFSKRPVKKGESL